MTSVTGEDDNTELKMRLKLLGFGLMMSTAAAVHCMVGDNPDLMHSDQDLGGGGQATGGLKSDIVNDLNKLNGADGIKAMAGDQTGDKQRDLDDDLGGAGGDLDHDHRDLDDDPGRNTA